MRGTNNKSDLPGTLWFLKINCKSSSTVVNETTQVERLSTLLKKKIFFLGENFRKTLQIHYKSLLIIYFGSCCTQVLINF